jgi:predicted nucleic acid-binding protein
VKRYVLDTNLYVRAFRNAQQASEVEDFVREFAPAIHLSSIVLHELLVGASTGVKRTEVAEAIGRPFRRTNRIITPSPSAWEEAGKGIARLAARERMQLRAIPKSLVHDFLLAESCRESGMTLITDNLADFQRIRRVTRFAFREPWPQ